MIITNFVVITTNVVNVASNMAHSDSNGWPLAFTLVGIMFGFAFLIKWS
jgi:hypothetical protein